MDRHFKRPKVWCWWGFEPSLGQSLVFLAAAADRATLKQACARMGIAPPGTAQTVAPNHPGFSEALRHPGQVSWMPLERFTERGTTWFDEVQFTAAQSKR